MLDPATRKPSRLPRPHVLALLVLLFAVPYSGAEDTVKGANEKKGAVDKKAAPAKVIDAYRAGPDKERTVSLGDDLVVEVEYLGTLLAEARLTTPPKKIVLFLDGRPIKGVDPFPPTDPAKSMLYFPLRRTEGSREVWTHILGKPGWHPRPTSVSVGLEDGYPVESDASVGLRVFREGWFLVWVCVFLVLLAAFLILANMSDLLRESGPNPSGARRPFSLSRTQAAWWFFIVLASYLFIGMVTGDYATTITGTVLVLIGISAGTVVGSAVIDAGKPQPNAAERTAAGLAVVATRRAADAEAVLTGAVAALNTIRNLAAAAQDNSALAPIGQAAAAALAAPAPAAPRKASWLTEILSDADGVSFHRFQNAAWTLVLGIIFVAQVYEVLAMPQFDNTLLALMGISAGTYLGLKIPEPPGKPPTA